jgi:lipopolysaccharide cholinephosphotransferase
MTFARVCDNEHTIVKTNHPWARELTGVWIDILPLDGLPSDGKVFLRLVNKIRRIQTKIYRLRTGRYLRLSETINIKDFISCLIKRMLYYKYDINTLLQQHIKLLQSHNYEESEYCGQLCVMDYPEKEHNPKVDFNHFIKMQFCGCEFYVMNGFDDILERYYGNYMELPPENQRVPKESSTQKYYWKKCN